MDVVNVILKPVAEVLMVPVKKHLGYMVSYRKYVQDMHTKMRELNVAKAGEEAHLDRNTRNRLEVPAQVRGWLEEVENINAKVENFPSEVLGCLDLKSRHKLGRKAFKISEEIKSVTTQRSLIQWTDLHIPLGRIDSKMASTSTTSSNCNDFQSREQTFREALKALGPTHGSHMVALCGMGGVGKTTMMKKLKHAVVEKKMFKHFVEVVVGEKTDPIAIQDAVADYLGITLNERTKPARTEKLRKWFVDNSDGGKNKFLLILDDVWQSVDLEDIGLSRLPNQGVDFKVLITSRDQALCTEIGVEANSVLKLRPLEEAEAQSLFHQFWKTSDHVDPEVHKIKEDIVRKCSGLPIAIKTMACTLTSKSKDTLKHALSRLENHDIKTIAPTIFQMSYDNLQDEVTEAIFLLCGLFPEDFNIPTEDLLRYGWGLSLFKGFGSVREARYRLNACIERLMHTNLLIESDNVGCVKMHDLVRAFVLDMFSKLEHASHVNHGSSNPGWPENDMSTSCKRISLTCKGMSEFPSELKFPNLLILKLMHGDMSLRFPEGFYGRMEKLQVISYDYMMHSLLPSFLESSTNLRVLLLHRCSMMFDLSSIGNLLNLEVLSFAESHIQSLPSTIKNLKKLRVLDVTDCGGLCIDIDVFNNLGKLEELYAKVEDIYEGTITFTGDNIIIEQERWKNLSALDFQFIENDDQWKNLSFEKLEQFKISAGRSLYGDDIERKHLLENTLKLVTMKGEVSGSEINKLFEKTTVLCLSVDDMNDLEEVDIQSSLLPRSSSFRNLKVLVVSECAKLRYLFTLSVAKVLPNLEHLEVYDCNEIKELIHLETSGDERITFPNLKFLSLSRLPNLLGLCQNVNMIALPQLVELQIIGIPNITSIYSNDKSAASCLFREEVLIPKLEKLHIQSIDDLKEIWPCDFITREEVKLRVIKVSACKNLLNLFPCNPMPLMHHLEELDVWHCGSIEELFNIDLDCAGEIGKEECISSLRRIDVYNSGQLREVWRIKGGENNSGLPILGFQAVESIKISLCERFRSVYTPATTNIDIGALIHLEISECGETGRNKGLVETSQEQEFESLSKQETSEVSDTISTLFSSCLIHSFYNLHELKLERYQGVEVVFEIESPQSQDNHQRILPYLEELNIRHMEWMSHVWKCNWNEFLFLQKQQSESPFHSLTTIRVEWCDNIKYLFSPLMAKLLSNLKKIDISLCPGIEEVVSNRDDEDKDQTAFTSTETSTTLFPHLDSLSLFRLQNLKCIGGGAKGGNSEISFNSTTITTTTFLDQYKFSEGDTGVSWSLCQYPREIKISGCDAFSSVIPYYAAGQMQKLQVLKIDSCPGMKEVFDTQGINKSVITLKLPNLYILEIDGCDLLEHIFTFSTLETLRQLVVLRIKRCKSMKVIVVNEEEHEGGQTAKSSSKVSVMFPHLNSIELVDLPECVGFFLGMNEFQWPSLEKAEFYDCPQMKVFTAGGSTAPQLKYVETSLGRYSPGHWLNSHVTTTTTSQHQESTSSSCPPATSQEINVWSFHNLIQLRVQGSTFFGNVIVPSNELLHLQNLEKVHITSCFSVEVVFEALEGTNSGFDESPTVVNFQKLRKVYLYRLPNLRYLWKTNRWAVFEFPNLTKFSISDCGSLQHIFTTSMVVSLTQLQELHIRDCDQMEEVVVKDANEVVEEEEEESDGKMSAIMLPHLRSIKLDKLPCLKGFCLGKEDFSFPLLDTLTIENCPAITTFTMGNLSTPELKEIETSLGSFSVHEDINSFIKTNQEGSKRDQVE